MKTARLTLLTAALALAALPASARITRSRSTASSVTAAPGGKPSLLTPFTH